MNVQPGFSLQGSEPIDDLAGPPRWRTGRRLWLLIGGALLLLLAGLLLWRMFAGGDEAAVPPQIPRVSVIVPGQQTVTNTVSATGSLAARREMPVGIAGEGGRVTAVLVDAGDWVRAGQTLAVIERSVQSQQANQLAAQIRAAQADAALAQAQLERAQALVSRGFVSKADLDQKTATRDAARARVAVAQAQLGEVRARIGQLDVRAPADGLVLARNVEPGQVVGSGSGMLFRVARGGEIELKAEMAEQDLAALRVGMTAQVTPVGGNRSFIGRIWLLSPVIDPQSRQGEARIALAYDPALRPGGFASAEVTSGTVHAAVLPESAVLSDDKGNFVFVIGDGNKVQRRAVTTGAVSDRGIAILSGLSGREQVVLSAGAFLNPGDPVIPERRAARG